MIMDSYRRTVLTRMEVFLPQHRGWLDLERAGLDCTAAVQSNQPESGWHFDVFLMESVTTWMLMFFEEFVKK